MSDLVPEADALFERVAAILDEARGNVVRAVNTNMVIAYWLIGRGIVVGVQEGEHRAEYGKHVLKRLSVQLQTRYGTGYSVPNLENSRRFYRAFQDREPISYPRGTKLAFAPVLMWSHYRALSHVFDPKAREFYEREPIESGWNKDLLERQIHSALHQRILANQREPGLIAPRRERLPGEPVSARDILRSPAAVTGKIDVRNWKSPTSDVDAEVA